MYLLRSPLFWTVYAVKLIAARALKHPKFVLKQTAGLTETAVFTVERMGYGNSKSLLNANSPQLFILIIQIFFFLLFSK